MMKTNTSLFILFIFMCLINSTYGSYKFVAKDSLPTELKLLVSEIQRDLDDKKEKDLTKSVFIIDSLFSNLNTEEIFFIAKTEIYKIILENRPSLNPRRIEVPNNLSDAGKELEKRKLSPFKQWLALAIFEDLNQIAQDPNYLAYLKNYQSGKQIIKTDQRKLKKKLEIILPWYRFIMESSNEEINSFLGPHLWQIIKTIGEKSYLLSEYSRFRKSKLNVSHQLTYFKKVKEKKEVDPIINLFPKADTNYKPPKTLPRPVDDWIPRDNMGEEDFAVEKKQLPEPVDDWLEEL